MEYSEKKIILFVDNISVGYNGVDIIKKINFQIKDINREGFKSTGQSVAILGRSGRGKSTFFKALSGLIKPTFGNILIKDFNGIEDDTALVLSEGSTGFIDQKYTLFRHKTVLQICKYALNKSSLREDEKLQLITKYLVDWGLEEHAQKYSCELSGGQKQRTSILENILRNKRFLIMDEPASGLDVGNLDKLKQYFKQFSSENEYNTIIFSTHDIKLAVEMADSIYILGYPEGVTDYSTIVKHYDLKAMGLAWQEYGDGHRQLCADIRELLLKS